MATIKRMAQLYATAAEFTSTNPVLLAGEFGVESDTQKYKVGNGTAVWTALPYVAASESLQEGTPETITGLWVFDKIRVATLESVQGQSIFVNVKDNAGAVRSAMIVSPTAGLQLFDPVTNVFWGRTVDASNPQNVSGLMLRDLDGLERPAGSNVKRAITTTALGTFNVHPTSSIVGNILEFDSIAAVGNLHVDLLNMPVGSSFEFVQSSPGGKIKLTVYTGINCEVMENGGRTSLSGPIGTHVLNANADCSFRLYRFWKKTANTAYIWHISEM